MQARQFNDVQFDAELIARYDGRGPRYTSYPTAPVFDAAFGERKYREHVRQSNSSERPLSIYLHIPFCQSLCYYCGCNKIVTRNQERIARYLRYLHREIDLQAELFDSSRRVEQIHFGGGTPSYLSKNQLTELMQKLSSSFSLAAPSAREVSIEVDPRTVDKEAIQFLARLGFNRLSLGIQDFDDTVQRAVNRVQTEADVQCLIETARNEGFESISFDLIYGLPMQSTTGFEQTLRTVIDMRPDRLAIYNYAHLPERFKGQRMIREQQLPSAETKLELLQLAINRLGSAGYRYIGMDHFALPHDSLVQARRQGTLQRNFQGYSTHRLCDLIGLGVSSIGNVGHSYSQNVTATREYEAILDRNQLPISKGLAVDEDDIIRRDVIQSLMCYDRVDFATVDNQHEISFKHYFANEIKRLEPMVADHLVVVSDHAIQVSARGRMLMRNIAMTFDRHLGQSGTAARYSKAI